MVAEAYIDRTSTLEGTERNGTFTRLVRRATVKNLADTDYIVLMSALEAAGIPEVGTGLTGNPFANLVLTERNPRVVDDRVVEVDLVYEFAINEGQSIDVPPFGALVGETSATTGQTERNTDIEGNPITVSHTYPADDPDYPSKTVEQGGIVQFAQIQTTCNYEGVLENSHPWLIQARMIGAINSVPWNSGLAHEWMCTKSAWKLHDAGTPNRYRFSFEFQKNLDTWDYTVVFIDDRTGKPPVDLVAGVGTKTIRIHKEVDFEEILLTRVQGG